jgi:hypothetical protein
MLGPVLDLCGLAALGLGLGAGDLPGPLAVGYTVTTLGVLCMLAIVLQRNGWSVKGTEGKAAALVVLFVLLPAFGVPFLIGPLADEWAEEAAVTYAGQRPGPAHETLRPIFVAVLSILAIASCFGTRMGIQAYRNSGRHRKCKTFVLGILPWLCFVLPVAAFGWQEFRACVNRPGWRYNDGYTSCRSHKSCQYPTGTSWQESAVDCAATGLAPLADDVFEMERECGGGACGVADCCVTASCHTWPAGWYSNWRYDCAYVASIGSCQSADEGYATSADGTRAAEACCECGGGQG